MCEYGQEKEKKHDLIIIKHNSQQEQHKQLSEDGSGVGGVPAELGPVPSRC